MNTEHFTVPEVAVRYKVSESKVYAMVASREMGHLKFGRTIRISQEHLQEYERGNNRNKKRVRPF